MIRLAANGSACVGADGMLAALDLIERVAFGPITELTTSEVSAFAEACRRYWPEGLTTIYVGDALGVRAEMQECAE